MVGSNQNINTLQNVLNDDVNKYLNAEIQLKNSLNEWLAIANSVKLKGVLQKYLAFVESHIQKLEEFYEEEKITSISNDNRIMKAFIEETNEKLGNCKEITLQEVCLLASVQAINHYKISAYGTAAAFANTLGMEKRAAIFHEASVNEKQIDDRLTQLAEYEINKNAKTHLVIEE